MRVFFKAFYSVVCAGFIVLTMAGCSTNPATGENQFAALMSPQQEARIGAGEHANILKQYGGVVRNQALQDYVRSIGQKLAANTERPEVTYQFFVLDSPVMNAFALPGGYVYVTRGLLALANSEAQLASVLSHEIGHVTARHSAERYSHSVVTSLGATILAAAFDSKSASKALGIGSNLYISSYSRAQESQADDLGIRYLHRAGYDPAASARFLTALERYAAFESRAAGKAANNDSYFSTHPQTAERAEQAAAIAASYPALSGASPADRHFHQIDGMIFGDSPEQGFVRGSTFWHPGMGFIFTTPTGYVIVNTPAEVIAKDPASGTIILFDSAIAQATDPATYLSQTWMKGDAINDLETITISGKRAATASFAGKISNVPVTVRLVAVEWVPGTFYRFQMAIPPTVSLSVLEGLKTTTDSLRPITAAERSRILPRRLKLVTARAGDNVVSLSSVQPFPTLNEQRFRALNNMDQTENVVPGQVYKLITE